MLEDVASDAELIRHRLKQAGMAIETQRVQAEDEFLRELKTCQPGLILADYALPAFDGLAALALARSVYPDVPFILVSGELGEERAIESLKRGATDYVLKDRLARLLPAVMRALEEAEERRKLREAETRVKQRTAELEAANARLRALSRRLVEIQEAQSRAISRNLHDETGQGMTAIKLGLGLLRQEEACTEAMRSRIDELHQVAEDVQEGLHRLAMNLRPPSLDRHGLVPALEQFLTAFRRLNTLQVDFLASGLDQERLADEVETALYRIVQEGLINVARHARADRAEVIVTRTGDVVNLIIEDDGCGFDPDEALQRERLGLLGMRERAEMLGGSLTVESKPGAGTAVYVDVPVQPSSA